MATTTGIHSCELKTEDCLGTMNLRNWSGMVVCENCYQVETRLKAAMMTPAAQEARVADMRTSALKVDETIQVRTDLFNAETTSIIELKRTIDADESITNKPYALAEQLTERFNHFKKVVFELNEQLVTAANTQKAIQVYLNQLANSLREEERNKLHIADINYTPKAAKVAKPKAIKTASKKLDKNELRKYAAEIGVSEFTLQMVVVSQGKSIAEAAEILKKLAADAKAN